MSGSAGSQGWEVLFGELRSSLERGEVRGVLASWEALERCRRRERRGVAQMEGLLLHMWSRLERDGRWRECDGVVRVVWDVSGVERAQAAMSELQERCHTRIMGPHAWCELDGGRCVAWMAREDLMYAEAVSYGGENWGWEMSWDYVYETGRIESDSRGVYFALGHPLERERWFWISITN